MHTKGMVFLSRNETLISEEIFVVSIDLLARNECNLLT